MINFKNFKWIIALFAIVAALGYGICIFSVFVTVFQGDLIDRPICFNSECLDRFANGVAPALAFGKATSDLVVAIATAGGIVIALWSYFTAVSNSALGNHISHFSIFQSYLNSEIDKRNRVSSSSIDTFLWYNLIFPKSKTGLMIVSDMYKKHIKEIHDIVCNSNTVSTTAIGGTFRYRPHQTEMKEKLAFIGISISIQPRIEYYEIEDQIISLIDCVNGSFCLEEEIKKIAKRKYS